MPKQLEQQQIIFMKQPLSALQDQTHGKKKAVSLLTQLFNPDPEIIPLGHPHNHSTHGVTPVASPIPISSTVKVPPTWPVSSMRAGSMKTKALPSTGVNSEAMGKFLDGVHVGSTSPLWKNPPGNEDVQDDYKTLLEIAEINAPTSVAVEKLKALADRKGITPRHNLDHQVGGGTPYENSVHQQDDRSKDVRLRRSFSNLQLSNDTPEGPTNAISIPLPWPYNLPLPTAPMSPRTTRSRMLASELSESLRRNLLWERESGVGAMAIRRRAHKKELHEVDLVQPLASSSKKRSMYGEDDLPAQPQQGKLEQQSERFIVDDSEDEGKQARQLLGVLEKHMF